MKRGDEGDGVEALRCQRALKAPLGMLAYWVTHCSAVPLEIDQGPSRALVVRIPLYPPAKYAVKSVL
ncbi:hypothetical protein [Desulfosporosinus sp. FKA]|uniref:hypothetical protein n=1 Tax=Desulfosporosinus sp. FKA TaxID=1969834 RepID=UPI000B499A25|nr:hypothetical protein [Desulfosporosinus sp. FKA]